MMYICNDCGAVLDEDELHTERSYVSDYMGGCYEEYTACHCGGSVSEAVECEGCGEYFDEDDLTEGFCEECLKEEMTVDNALKCGETAKQEVEINGFLAAYFSEEDINTILTKALEEQIDKSRQNAMCIMDAAEEWCKEDISFFADWLKSQEVK